MMTVDLYSQWSNGPNVNLQITNWGDAPISAVEDGRGGAFISASWNAPLDRPPWSTRQPILVWVDKFGYHKLDTLYSLGGNGEKYRDLKLIKDGTGNYFAVFVDRFFAIEHSSPSWDIYQDRIMIQKFDSLGHKLLGEGIYISADTVMQHTFFETAIDEKGGCFIYFEAMDSLGSLNDNGERLVQYITPNGERAWGDRGITLYKGRIHTSIYSNYLIYNNANGVIVNYENDGEDVNYLVNMDSTGFINWKIPTRNFYASSKLVFINQKKFAIIGIKFNENPFSASVLFDKILLSGSYEDSVITLTNSFISAERFEYVHTVGDKIFFTLRGDSSYFQKIDTLGNKYFGEIGTKIFDQSGYIIKTFTLDSSFVFATDHYARKINFSGKDLWKPEILQYTTRTMGYSDFVTDGNGGFMAFWLENLNGIWGQQANAKGELGIVTDVIDLPSGILPDNFTLYQNYPNPFNPVTLINYILSTGGYVELKVFDILGREISTLVKEEKAVGLHTVRFYEKELPSGVYFYTLIVKGLTTSNIVYKATKKMLIIK